jgi:hypothetical protein
LPAIRKGTTLYVACTEDGIVMAADDLMYEEQRGEAVPLANEVFKVVAFDKVLIGTAGVMLYSTIKYEFQDWITTFVHAQQGGTPKSPLAIAEALYDKMRTTFQPIGSMLKCGDWKSYLPNQRVVSYLIAGYTKEFTKPFIYEIGTEINADGSGLRYLSPSHRPNEDCWIGEDKFLSLATGGREPQLSTWNEFIDTLHDTVAATFLNLPTAFQTEIASVVGLIKVEGKYNSQKVGHGVNVGVIDRAKRRVLLGTL